MDNEVRRGFEELSCDEKDCMAEKNCKYCFISTEDSIHSRRCFMTGEYCSRQSNIQRKRKKLHDSNCITAFVIMNFSDMSDVVYKWRLQNFIESLSKYLYIDKKKNRLYCGSAKEEAEIEKEEIKEIKVVRSDSNPASNYVVCSRICQQMQIADIVVVDVSSQNANVFYEFGMAVALGKLILPICYSESFYKMIIPKVYEKKYWELTDDERQKIEHHIGLYPWRKNLFEYYGIRYKDSENDKNSDSKSEYLEYEEAIKVKYGFSDVKYNRFPYNETLYEDGDRIGKKIYDKLREGYNQATKKDNTLIVYTMDAFLNEEQAGLCIVNFYHGITARMRQERCFCGERVGVLVQENVIPESEKDSKEQLDILYSVGEIIQIGVNQATYLAAEEKIKSEDDFEEDDFWKGDFSGKEDFDIIGLIKPTEFQKRDIRSFIKGYIKNRGMRIYPNNPVFVDRMKNHLHKDLLESKKTANGNACDCCDKDSFCLYHVMIRTLRYTNEIVVDISDNCLQSLFWLGAAHASDIYAITVMHEETDREKEGRETERNFDEREAVSGNVIKKEGREKRYVFDVAGLWMAILRKNDIEGFYQQLTSVQKGIEYHSKLMLSDNSPYRAKMSEFLFSDIKIDEGSEDEVNPILVRNKKDKEEKEILESYYRNHFWTPMLAYNQLSIYISQISEPDKNNDPRLCTSSWDFEAISVLSHYLSKRKVIGEYFLKSQPYKKGKEDVNFICIGTCSKPELAEYIYGQIKDATPFDVIHEKIEKGSNKICNNKSHLQFKGFRRVKDEEKDEEEIFVTHQPKIKNCMNCKIMEDNTEEKIENNSGKNLRIVYSKENLEEQECYFCRDSVHSEMAQLILWREDPKNLHGHCYFWVGIMGCSGPATYALSTMFVDKEQRASCFEPNNMMDKGDDNLLCELQEHIRKKFVEVFFENFNVRLNGEQLMSSDNKKIGREQKIRYLSLVRYAIIYYLRTVLYKYFFPFLSEKDVDRIYNGMYTFVNSMKAAKVSPFALNYPHNGDKDFSSAISNDSINKIVEIIPEVLLFTMKSFKGLEAFYNVEVVHHLGVDGEYKTDTRSVQKIEMLNADVPNINYFFVK